MTEDVDVLVPAALGEMLTEQVAKLAWITTVCGLRFQSDAVGELK